MSIREPAYRCRLTKFKAASLSFLPWTLHSPLQPGFSLPLPNWFNDEIEKWRFFSKISKHEPLCYNLETLHTRNTEEKTPEVESPRHASRRIKTHTCSPRREFLVTRISSRIKSVPPHWKRSFADFRGSIVPLTTTGDTFTEIGGGWKDSNLKLTKETSKLSGGKFLPSISRPRVNHLVRVENRIFSFHSLNWERQLQPYLYSAIHFREEFREKERIRYVLTTLEYSTLNLNFTKWN